MQLKVLGSSSKGNSYLLTSSTGETLVIEAGVKFSEVKEAVNFDVANISGLLCSHSHLDHSKYINDFAKAGVNVFANAETFKAKCDTFEAFKLMPHRHHAIKHGGNYTIGNFKVLPFEVKHDVPCLGFIIRHSESGAILFLSDTMFSPYTFKNLSHILIEANYSKEILSQRMNAGELESYMRNRILFSHLSFEECQNILKANDLSKVKTITLLHLSSGNSDASHFKKTIQELTGKQVHIAEKGLVLDLSLQEF